MSHPDPNQIELFAIGVLDPEEIADIAEHLDHCSHCSSEVARELEFERKLGELGRYADRDQPLAPVHDLASKGRRRSVARVAAIVVGAVGAMAAAAAVAFVLIQNLGQDAARARAPALISPICEGQPQLCLDAEQHGLVPALTATTIPRYEHLAPLPPATDRMLAFSRVTGGPQL